MLVVSVAHEDRPGLSCSLWCLQHLGQCLTRRRCWGNILGMRDLTFAVPCVHVHECARVCVHECAMYVV